MRAQLEHPRPPAVAPLPHDSGATDVPDPDRGITLLLSFTGALSVMVADVVVIGAVHRSWILIPGFAVLLLMAAIVFRGIMRLLADGAEPTASGAERGP
jgi:hypothetical protein